jgi:hypothetical protein
VLVERKKVRYNSYEDFDVANRQGRVGIVYKFIPNTTILRLVKYKPRLYTIKGRYTVIEMLYLVTIRL